jgi:hypothetical protein
MRTSRRPASSACRLALAAKALQLGVSGRPGTQPQRYAPHQAAASACERNSGRAGTDHQPIPGRAFGAGSENTICWTNNASHPSKASGMPIHRSRVGRWLCRTEELVAVERPQHPFERARLPARKVKQQPSNPWGARVVDPEDLPTRDRHEAPAGRIGDHVERRVGEVRMGAASVAIANPGRSVAVVMDAARDPNHRSMLHSLPRKRRSRLGPPLAERLLGSSESGGSLSTRPTLRSGSKVSGRVSSVNGSRKIPGRAVPARAPAVAHGRPTSRRRPRSRPADKPAARYSGASRPLGKQTARHRAPTAAVAARTARRPPAAATPSRRDAHAGLAGGPASRESVFSSQSLSLAASGGKFFAASRLLASDWTASRPASTAGKPTTSRVVRPTEGGYDLQLGASAAGVGDHRVPTDRPHPVAASSPLVASSSR